MILRPSWTWCRPRLQRRDAHGARAHEVEPGRAGRREMQMEARMSDWREQAANVEPEALVFATRLGTSISPNNVLRRSVFPACDRLKMPRATWLSFRRTYSS
jgi:hypothetical protein